MAPTKKASKVAASSPPQREATTDYETEESRATSGDGEVYSPSEFDSGRPVVSTAKANRKPGAPKYKKAEVVFPPGPLVKRLRDEKYAKIIRKTAGVYLAGVIEYLVGEMVEISKDQADLKKKKRIIPKHIFDGIAHDLEMQEVLKDVIIPGGGVTPGIHPSLIPKQAEAPKQTVLVPRPKTTKRTRKVCERSRSLEVNLIGNTDENAENAAHDLLDLLD